MHVQVHASSRSESSPELLKYCKPPSVAPPFASTPHDVDVSGYYMFCFPLPEVAAPWTEETVRQCLFLYLSLLPLNHRLVHELASVYTEAIADIKRSVLRVIEQPVSPLVLPASFPSYVIDPGPLSSW